MAERSTKEAPVVQTGEVGASWAPKAGTTSTAVGLAVLAVAVCALGSWRPSLWLDEVASLDAARRTPGELLTLLGHVDAVHGLYYLLLHGWTAVVGTSPFALRLLSALAVGAGAAGVVVLGTTLVDRATGFWAGLVFAVLPATTWFGTEARSSALVAAVTTWATVALMHGARGRWRWWPYAVLMALSGALFLESLLVLPAHAAAVAWFARRAPRPRRVLRSWTICLAAALVVAAPVAVTSWGEREQVWWIRRPGLDAVLPVLTEQWFGGSVALAAVAWLLVVGVCLMVVVPRWRHLVPAGGADLVAVAAPWLVLPTALLLLASRSVTPLWVPRYLAYCVPAAALLLGLAVSALARWWLRAAVVVLVVALALPVYLDQRAPTAKDGSDWSAVASFVQTQAHRGDAIVYVPADRHRSPRRAAEGYPKQFVGLRDVALLDRGARLGGLYDVGRPIEDVAADLDGVSRLWVLGTTDSNDDEPARTVTWLRSHGWLVSSRWQGPSTQILLATRS